MKVHPMDSMRSRRGFAAILSTILLTALAALAVAFCWLANANLFQSRGGREMLTAQMQAESGLAYLSYKLQRVELPIAGVGQEILDTVANHLALELEGSEEPLGLRVLYDGNTVTLPDMRFTDGGRTFRADMWMVGIYMLRLRMTGTSGDTQRCLEVDFAVYGGHPIFGYGLSSKGAICLEGNIDFLGQNNASEGDLLSMASGQAFRLLGTLGLDGDMYAADSNAMISVSGDGTIGGASMGGFEVWDHLHIGEGVPEFPEMDTAPFVPFATNIVDSNTDTAGLNTFKNIRIKAGTNPTFSGGTKLNGVIYVESPNIVMFAQGTTVTGIIVTEDAGSPGPDKVIKFENSTSCYGVEDLPDNEMFHELREMTGTFILAPSFRVKFENESGVINGNIAADHVKFENSFNGTLRGGIMCYGTDEVMAEDHSSFTIDRGKYTKVPAGFKIGPRRLFAQPQTYSEE
jgi:hypothetical protein